MRHHGALLGKSFGMSLLFLQEGPGNEEREVCIHMPGILEHAVELIAHVFPEGKAVRLDDHAAAHGGVIRQSPLEDQVVIPLCMIRLTGCDLFTHLI